MIRSRVARSGSSTACVSIPAARARSSARASAWLLSTETMRPWMRPARLASISTCRLLPLPEASTAMAVMAAPPRTPPARGPRPGSLRR